ncbi:MAG: flagellar hook-associated protein FlgK [bacterium]
MFSTWLGLNTAARGIFAAQRALDTTAQNITNANTPGYSRQRANLEAAPAFAYPSLSGIIPGQLGQGVNVTSIVRIRDEFLDSVYRRQNSGLGLHESQLLPFNQLETLLNEPSETGLGQPLAEFFNGWNELANTPESRPARTGLRETAQGLLDRFGAIKSQLDGLKAQQDAQIKGRVEDANQLIDQIADLNNQVAVVKASGQEPNDLKDRRDLLIDQLSTIVPAETYPGTSDSVVVQIGGVQVVNLSRRVHLETFADPQDPNTGIQLRFKEIRTPLDIRSGELKGLLITRDQTIPEVEGRLNKLASALVNRINLSHKQHYGLDGLSGRAFFSEIVTETRTGTVELATQFPATDFTAPVKLSDLDITAGSFTVAGKTFELSNADVDPSTSITVQDLFARINDGQPLVRASLKSDFTGVHAEFALYNPPDKATEITVLGGSSNALAVLGQLDATNTDAVARATYRGALADTEISGLILDDVGNIAAAGELAPGEFAGVGDNQGALAIADLADRQDIFPEGGSFDGFYNTAVSALGSRSQANARSHANQDALTQQADSARLSVSGVNLDEEAVELIKFQKAFEASSRVIAVYQSTYDTILNMVQ